MSTQTSRRRFIANTLKYTGLLAAGGAGVATMQSVLPPRSQAATSTVNPWPWPARVDPEKAMEMAYEGYSKGG